MSANEQVDERILMRELQNLPNIGPAGAKDLILLGIKSADDLKGCHPDDLYRELCEKTKTKQDPCVWDTLASVVHYAQTGERKKWWEFTPIRKARA